ncbi:MAG: hypothetical protein WD689_03135 [Gaiellaceae bacterium]
MHPRVRVGLAGIAAAGVLAHGAVAHGLPAMGDHEGMAGATVGFCLLVVVAAASSVLVLPGGLAAAPRPALVAPAGATPPAPARSHAGARASPSVLQRFRN